MPLYNVSDAGNAGSGLFAAQDIGVEKAILQEDRPLLAVLDSNHLKEACSWCFKSVGESPEPVELKVCTGCRILRFCNVECQTSAWKHSHKLECKLYKKLYPAVLPNTARMLMQALLRRKKSTFTEDDWASLYKLRSHIEDFRRSGGSGNETYQNIQLMSRAAQEYGETGDDLGHVETLAGRILVNTLTLVTPIYTPIGLALSTKTALLNHSCAPNCVVSFSGPQLTLRALRPISAGTELTISYIDITFPPPARRDELSGRYFFHCVCPACTDGTTLGHPDPPPSVASIPQAERDELEEKAVSYISDAAQARDRPHVAATCLARALVLFDRHAAAAAVPAWRQPLARVRSDLILQLLGCGLFVPALLQSLKQRLDADPVTFPEEAHPVKVARAWVLAKLVMQVEAVGMGSVGGDGTFQPAEGGQDVRDLQVKFGADWQLIAWALVKGVAGLVERSHGKGSVLDIEAKQAVSDMKTGFEMSGKGTPGEKGIRDCEKKMRTLADEGWLFWRSWQRDARRKSRFVPVHDGEVDDQDPIGILIGEHP